MAIPIMAMDITARPGIGTAGGMIPGGAHPGAGIGAGEVRRGVGAGAGEARAGDLLGGRHGDRHGDRRGVADGMAVLTTRRRELLRPTPPAVLPGTLTAI